MYPCMHACMYVFVYLFVHCFYWFNIFLLIYFFMYLFVIDALYTYVFHGVATASPSKLNPRFTTAWWGAVRLPSEAGTVLNERPAQQQNQVGWSWTWVKPTKWDVTNGYFWKNIYVNPWGLVKSSEAHHLYKLLVSLCRVKSWESMILGSSI